MTWADHEASGRRRAERELPVWGMGKGGQGEQA